MSDLGSRMLDVGNQEKHRRKISRLTCKPITKELKLKLNQKDDKVSRKSSDLQLRTSDHLIPNYKQRLTNNFQNNGKNQIWIN